MLIHTSRLAEPSLDPVTTKETIASAGNRTTERTVGAPTIAEAMIAAAQRMPFTMRCFRFMVISCRAGGGWIVTPNARDQGRCALGASRTACASGVTTGGGDQRWGRC